MAESTTGRMTKSSRCRRGDHESCFSETCSCDCHGTTSAAGTATSEAPPDDAPSGMTWEDPPRRGGAHPCPVTPEMLEQLQANPGRWARVATYAAKSGATNMRTKAPTVWPDRFQFLELRAHRLADDDPDGGSALFARWTA